jgi:hypothetical protein
MKFKLLSLYRNTKSCLDLAAVTLPNNALICLIMDMSLDGARRRMDIILNYELVNTRNMFEFERRHMTACSHTGMGARCSLHGTETESVRALCVAAS